MRKLRYFVNNGMFYIFDKNCQKCVISLHHKQKENTMSKEMTEWISTSAEVAMLIDELDLEFIGVEE